MVLSVHMAVADLAECVGMLTSIQNWGIGQEANSRHDLRPSLETPALLSPRPPSETPAPAFRRHSPATATSTRRGVALLPARKIIVAEGTFAS
jgi:hypothetical protein